MKNDLLYASAAIGLAIALALFGAPPTQAAGIAPLAAGMQQIESTR